jgi:hypothetical protein
VCMRPTGKYIRANTSRDCDQLCWLCNGRIGDRVSRLVPLLRQLLSLQKQWAAERVRSGVVHQSAPVLHWHVCQREHRLLRGSGRWCVIDDDGAGADAGAERRRVQL